MEIFTNVSFILFNIHKDFKCMGFTWLQRVEGERMFTDMSE